ncbi:MAG: helix-turn-helix transcriptional regulator [Anaerocolumna sp.]
MYYDIKKSGKRIKKLRIDRKLSQEDVSADLGISIDGYRKIERGANGAKVDTLVCIADYFGVSLDFIIAGKLPKFEMDVMLKGKAENEKKFINYMVSDIIKNIDLLKE